MLNHDIGQQLVYQTIDTINRCVEIMDYMKLSKEDRKHKKMDSSAVIQNGIQRLNLNGCRPQNGTSSLLDDIVVEPFRDENQMADIMQLIAKDLSEPYSVYTYRYFVQTWPSLCFLARNAKTNQNVGVIVCKIDFEPVRTGYIAMLAVDQSLRRCGIASRLVREAINTMSRLRCVEISLETEVTNEKALGLYNGLGFIREKRYYRYYLNGSDAFRLKLPLQPKEERLS